MDKKQGEKHKNLFASKYSLFRLYPVVVPPPLLYKSEARLYGVLTNGEPASYASHARQILVPSPVVLKNSFIIIFCPFISTKI